MPVAPRGGLAKGKPAEGGTVGENIPKAGGGENGPTLCGFGRYGVGEDPGENVAVGENILL